MPTMDTAAAYYGAGCYVVTKLMQQLKTCSTHVNIQLARNIFHLHPKNDSQ